MCPDADCGSICAFKLEKRNNIEVYQWTDNVDVVDDVDGGTSVKVVRFSVSFSFLILVFVEMAATAQWQPSCCYHTVMAINVNDANISLAALEKYDE